MRLTKPIIRADCKDSPRPCPWISCFYHMIWEQGDMKRLFKQKTDDEIVNIIMKMKDSCVLDMVDQGKCTLQEIGNALGITRERVRQIEGMGRGYRFSKISRIGGIKKLRHPSRSTLLKEFNEP